MSVEFASLTSMDFADSACKEIVRFKSTTIPKSKPGLTGCVDIILLKYFTRDISPALYDG